ncbi:hypothetical protein BKA93DRAFT_745099 [Sparassis latifolia]
MFKYFFTLACLAATALAQSAFINLPVEYDSFSPGDNLTVQITRPDTLTGSDEVAIAIALQSCASYTGGCAVFDVTQRLGTVLYQGPFAPAFEPVGFYEPYQNFTVQVPTSFSTGQASLSLSHFSLVGVSPFLSLRGIWLANASFRRALTRVSK